MKTHLRLPLLLVLLCPACGRESAPARYGEKVSYRQGRAITFPDFTLTFNGRRRVVPPQYPRGWWAYDFTIRSDANVQTITWSAGTGLIDAADFSVNGRSFALELTHAKNVGALREGELVVSSTAR